MDLALNREQKSTKINLSTFYFLSFFGIGALLPLLSVYLQENVGLTGAQIGTIMSISPVVTILVQPFWGVISDYTQKPRLVLTVALIGTAITGFAYSFVDEYVWFIAVAALLALTQSALIPISDSISLNYVQKTNGNYGSIRLWGALGYAGAVYFAGKLSEAFGISSIFYIFVVTLLTAAIFSWNLPKESQSMQVNIKKGISSLIRLPRFVLFLLTTFLIIGPILANNTYFGIFINDIGGSLAGVGLAFLLAAGSEAPFMKFAGNWINKLGMMKVLLMAGIISCLRWFFYFFEPSIQLVYLTTIAQGFSVGLFIPAALQYVRDITPGNIRATAVSVYSAFGNGLGSWFCIFVGGYILEQFSIGSVYLFFCILTGLGILTLIATMALDKKKQAAG